jgi:predicted O-linked N-acetylglucosamine transferase (SPINDLY family)
VASVLSSVGLRELIAETTEDYRRIAGRIAGDLPRLAELRARLRGQMSRSSLCDGPTFTRGLEEAYRHMWQRWCDNRSRASRAAFER